MRLKPLIVATILLTATTPAFADTPPVLSVGPDGRPLPGFNDKGEAISLPAPSAPPLTKDGTLAVGPDGKPLPGFNDKGEAIALPTPTPSGVQAFDANGKPLVGFNDKGEAISLIPPTYNKITDQVLKAKVDAEISQAKINAIKQADGYQLFSTTNFSAVDKSLTVIASKPGARSKVLKLSVDATGELFLPTKSNLSGYKIQIKSGSKVLKSIKLS
jgi:hypothetical protein